MLLVFALDSLSALLLIPRVSSFLCIKKKCSVIISISRSFPSSLVDEYSAKLCLDLDAISGEAVPMFSSAIVSLLFALSPLGCSFLLTLLAVFIVKLILLLCQIFSLIPLFGYSRSMFDGRDGVIVLFRVSLEARSFCFCLGSRKEYFFPVLCTVL